MTVRRPPKKMLEAAVRAWQLYAGATSCRVVDAQRLYTRAQQSVDRVARASGLSTDDVRDQLTTEAQRRGPVCPTPGKDI